MSSRLLLDLSDQLNAEGIDPGQLAQLQVHLDVLENPTAVNSLGVRLQTSVAQQWRNLVGEFKESVEAMGLLRKGLIKEELTVEERHTIRTQLLDVVRIVPATMIALANSIVPIPGTSLFTPWLLVRLGLMPSRWKEAHLLHELEKEESRLRIAGHEQAAARVDAIQQEVRREAEARDTAKREASLLTYWDTNNDGVLDANELDAYWTEVSRLRQVATTARAHRVWYCNVNGQVFGPARLSQLTNLTVTLTVLVCFDGQSGWIALEDLTANA